MKVTRELIKKHSGQIFRVGIFALWLGVMIGSMSIMLVYASQKTIEIADSASDGKQQEKEAASQNTRTKQLSFAVTTQQEKQFVIPLTGEVQADAVTVENRYMDKELWITIIGMSLEKYADRAVSGRTSVIKEGYLEQHGDGVMLKLHMDDVYEYRTTLNNEFLTVNYHEPHELYRTVVVVDAAGNSTEGANTTQSGEHKALQEKEVTVAVAKKLQQQFVHEEIKLYFAGLEATDISEEKILDLVEATGADLFISLGAESKEGADYGIAGYYNDTYYIAGYGNVDVADALTRNVTIAAKNKALGLYAVAQDDLLRQIKVPAARVSLGALMHEKEGQLLREEQYGEKLVQGVYEAILEMHYAMHPGQEQ